MATTAVNSAVLTARRSERANLRDLLALAVAGGLPLGLFGLVNLAGEGVGILPLFFAPYGLPGWLGAATHLGLLFLIGVSAGLAVQRGGRAVLGWVAALVAGMIGFPFIAPWLDSLQLAFYALALFLLCAATSYRLSRHSALAGLLMLPTLAWLGLGTALGLTMAAAWTPPFALTQANQPITPMP